jgi:hypothetical protein
MPAMPARRLPSVLFLAMVHAACADQRRPEAVGRAAEADTSEWKIVQVADFNDDGMQDVLWHNPHPNRIAVQLTRGDCLEDMGPEIPGPGEDWNAVTAADFNGDGLQDVLWYNAATNRMAVWLMQGTTLLAPGPEIPGPPGDGWEAANAGDFNYDGMADVIWRNVARNSTAIWKMHGTLLLEPGPEIPGPP